MSRDKSPFFLVVLVSIKFCLFYKYTFFSSHIYKEMFLCKYMKLLGGNWKNKLVPTFFFSMLLLGVNKIENSKIKQNLISRLEDKHTTEQLETDYIKLLETIVTSNHKFFNRERTDLEELLDEEILAIEDILSGTSHKRMFEDIGKEDDTLIYPKTELQKYQALSVSIVTRDSDSEFFFLGNGVYLSYTGNILTNSHVVEPMIKNRNLSQFAVFNFNGSRLSFPVEISYYEKSKDLALVHIEDFPARLIENFSYLPYLQFGTLSLKRTHEAKAYVVTHGNTQNFQREESSFSNEKNPLLLTTDNKGNFSGFVESTAKINSQIPILPGYSGSPVFTRDHYLTGLILSSDKTKRKSSVIDASEIREFLENYQFELQNYKRKLN